MLVQSVGANWQLAGSLDLDPPHGRPSPRHYGGGSEFHPWSLGVVAPRDIATGQASGKRQWKPVNFGPGLASGTGKLLRTIDHLSPHIKTAIQNHFVIPKLAVTTPQGTIVLHKVKFTDKDDDPDNEIERIKFTFQKIEETFSGGGKSSIDDWGRH